MKSITRSPCLASLSVFIVCLQLYSHPQSSSAQEIQDFDICGEFRFSRDTPSKVFLSHKKALIHIQAGKLDGTGFVIDSAGGYILTAAHVIADLINKPGQKIIGLSNITQAGRLELDYVKHDDKADVALLRVRGTDALKQVTPFEISMDTPEVGGKVAIAGYQFGGPVATPGESTLPAIGRKLILRVNTFDGDSGAPAIDESGLVIGIVTNRQDNGIAVMVPMAVLRDFLLPYIPDPKEPDPLFESLLKGHLDSEQFDPKSSPGAITNIDIIGLMKKLKSKKLKDLTENTRRLIRCPVYEAAEQRNLVHIANDLIWHLLPRTANVGKSFQKTGDFYAQIGDTSTARVWLAKSDDYIKDKLFAYTQSNSEKVAMALCRVAESDPLDPDEKTIGKKALDRAFEWILGTKPDQDVNWTITSCDSDPQIPDNAFANLVVDYNSVRFDQLSLDDSPTKSDLEGVRKGAAFAATLANDTAAYGRSARLVADTYLVDAQFENARAAYATAWNSGDRSSHVVAGYSKSNQIKGEKDGLIGPLTETDISSSKTLSRADFKLIMGGSK